MFGHITKKQAVSADLGPISKELIKIENGIEELKKKECNSGDLTPITNKIQGVEEIVNNNNKLVTKVWNSVAGEANNIFVTLWGLYNKSVGDANSTFMTAHNIEHILTNSLNDNNLIEKLSDTNYVYINQKLLSERKFLYIDYYVYNRYVLVKILNPYRLRKPGSQDVTWFEFITTDVDNMHKLYNSMNKMDCSYEITSSEDRKEPFTIDLMTQSCTTGKLQTIMLKASVGQAEIIYGIVAVDTDFDWNCYILEQQFILPFKKI